MGIYINPKGTSKEAFLKANGTEVDIETVK